MPGESILFLFDFVPRFSAPKYPSLRPQLGKACRIRASARRDRRGLVPQQILHVVPNIQTLLARLLRSDVLETSPSRINLCKFTCLASILAAPVIGMLRIGVPRARSSGRSTRGLQFHVERTLSARLWRWQSANRPSAVVQRLITDNTGVQL